MSAWGARQVQIVWFAQTPFEPKARDIFALITKDEPTATQTGQMPSATGLTSFELAQGMTPQYVYNIQKQPNRIDLILQPSPDLGHDNATEKFENVVEISELMKDWGAKITEKMEKVNRVGIVANLIVEQNSRESASRDLIYRTGLSNSALGKGVDMNLQLNFPSQKSWGRLNRITRWHVENFRSVQITMQGSFQIPTMGAENYVSALMLDFNTIASVPYLEKETIKMIINDAISDIGNIWETGNLSRLEE